MGWTETIALMFAASLALLLWRLLNPPPLLVIDDRGILDRRLHLGWIRWDEIEGAYSAPPEGGVVLRVRVSERLSRALRGRRPSGMRNRTVPDRVEIPVHLRGTELSEFELLQEILAHGGKPDPA